MDYGNFFLGILYVMQVFDVFFTFFFKESYFEAP